MIQGVPEIPELKAIVLFGSQARGDATEASDTDICAIISSVGFERMLACRQFVAEHYRLPIESVSTFTIDMLMAMARRGSLFVRHLVDEGKPILDTDGLLIELATKLRKFTGFEREVCTYRCLLCDVKEALSRGTGLSELDLHVLQVIVRNLCILLAYKNGIIVFGRKASFQFVSTEYAMPVSNETFEDLETWHKVYTGGTHVSVNLPLPARAAAIVEEVERLLSLAEGVLK